MIMHSGWRVKLKNYPYILCFEKIKLMKEWKQRHLASFTIRIKGLGSKDLSINLHSFLNQSLESKFTVCVCKFHKRFTCVLTERELRYWEKNFVKIRLWQGSEQLMLLFNKKKASYLILYGKCDSDSKLPTIRCFIIRSNI